MSKVNFSLQANCSWFRVQTPPRSCKEKRSLVSQA